MASLTADVIAVVTFTVDRPEALWRAMESVQIQRGVTIHHIVASEHADTLRIQVLPPLGPHRVSWIHLDGRPGEGFASARMARLRQGILAQIHEPWVAYLDDDNLTEPGHYSGLIELAKRSGCAAVHSWRHLVEADGRPFDGMRYPWHPDPAIAMELWQWCRRHGVITPGSAVIRDGRISDPAPWNVSTVDMNEWLMSTDLLRSVGFDATFTAAEAAAQVGEDDKLLRRLEQAGITIACTRQPTIAYHLGGVSNR